MDMNETKMLRLFRAQDLNAYDSARRTRRTVAAARPLPKSCSLIRRILQPTQQPRLLNFLCNGRLGT